MIRLWFDFVVLLRKCGKPFATGPYSRMTYGNIVATGSLNHRRCGKNVATGPQVLL